MGRFSGYAAKGMRRRWFRDARSLARARGAYMNVKISLKLSRTSSAPWEGTRRVISRRRRFRPFGEFATSRGFVETCAAPTRATSAAFVDSSLIICLDP